VRHTKRTIKMNKIVKRIVGGAISTILLLIALSIIGIMVVSQSKEYSVSVYNNVTHSYSTKVVRAYPYGVFDPEQKVKNVQYRVSTTAIVFAILTVPTIITTVAIIGWYLYEPVQAINQ